MQIILTIFGYFQFGDFALLRNLTFPILRRQHDHFRPLKPIHRRQHNHFRPLKPIH